MLKLSKFLHLLIRLCIIFHITSAADDALEADHDPNSLLDSLHPGLNIVRGTCAPASITAINKALESTLNLARASLIAAQNFSSVPFNRFFLPDARNATFAAEGMVRVIDAIQGHGVSIGIMCWDFKEMCNPSSQVLAYATPEKGLIPLIVYCPAGLAHPLSPAPCTQPPGRPSIGEVTLHELWHLRQISGTEHSLQDEEYSARGVMEAAAAGNDTSNNAQAYALLGSWSHALGLLEPDSGGHTCLENIEEAIIETTEPIHLVPVLTYCLLGESDNSCGLDFVCTAVRLNDPGLVMGTEFSSRDVSEVGVCVSVHSNLDYSG